LNTDRNIIVTQNAAVATATATKRSTLVTKSESQITSSAELLVWE